MDSELNEPLGGYKVTYTWGSPPGWRHQRTLNSPPPMTTPDLQLDMKQTSLGKKPKTSLNDSFASHESEERRPVSLKQVGEAGTHLARNPSPGLRPTLRGNCNTRAAEEWRVWSRRQDLQLKDKPPEHSALKTSGATSRRCTRDYRPEKYLSKGSQPGLTSLRFPLRALKVVAGEALSPGGGGPEEQAVLGKRGACWEALEGTIFLFPHCPLLSSGGLLVLGSWFLQLPQGYSATTPGSGDRRGPTDCNPQRESSSTATTHRGRARGKGPRSWICLWNRYSLVLTSCDLRGVF